METTANTANVIDPLDELTDREVLIQIAMELAEIDIGDLTKAEKNIIKKLVNRGIMVKKDSAFPNEAVYKMVE